MWFFLFISVYTDLQMFGLEMDGEVSGGEGYKLSETTFQQGGLWYMVHNYILGFNHKYGI